MSLSGQKVIMEIVAFDLTSISFVCVWVISTHTSESPIKAIMEYKSDYLIEWQQHSCAVIYLVCRWCTLLQAMFMADKTPPQHRVVTGWTFTLYWQELGWLWLQEMFGKADHVTIHITGWVETAELLWYLEEIKNNTNCVCNCVFKFLQGLHDSFQITIPDWSSKRIHLYDFVEQVAPCERYGDSE